MAIKKLVLCSALISSSLMAADDLNKRFYLQGNLGYAIGVAPGGNFEQNTLGEAGVYGAAIGYRFDEHLRADFGIENRKGFKNQFSVDNRVGKVSYTDTQSTKVNSLSSMFSLYYDIATINKVTPYVMFGAGMARNETTSNKGTFSGYSNGNPDRAYNISNGTQYNFAYKLGAGATYSVSNTLSCDLHYQYANLGQIKTGNIFSSPAGTDHTDNLRGKLQSHEFLLGMSYKF